MEPRKEVSKRTLPRRKETKPKLRIIKLEARIAPKLATNHNETLVRDRSARAR
jgi:hypothetical protein